MVVLVVVVVVDEVVDETFVVNTVVFVEVLCILFVV